MTINPNYEPLRFITDTANQDWSSREFQAVAHGMHGWRWADPLRRKNLPALLHVTSFPERADVIVRWKDDMGFVDKEIDDPTAGKVNRQVPVLGNLDMRGSKPVIHLSRRIFVEVDPTNWYRAAQHEFGHALGLVHDDGGIMAGINLSPAIITQRNREKAAALRLAGVVGVNSLEGN